MTVKKNVFACESESVAPRRTAAERVFETARDLFYRRGIRAVGVEEIVNRAGVTKPSLYRAFASKDDLVTACLQASAMEKRAELDEVIAAASPDPLEQLRAVLRHFAAMIAAPNFRGCPMSNTAIEFPEPGHPARVVLEGCKTGARARLVELARKLPARDPEMLADGLLLIIEGAIATHHIFGSQGPSAMMMATAEALIAAHVDNC